MTPDSINAWSGVFSAGVTVTLVVVTWRYAASTDKIARDTARAAESAELAARVALAQGVWSIQPKISIRSWSPVISRALSEARLARPSVVRLTIRNTGLATAEHFRVELAIHGEKYEGADVPSDALDPGRDFEIRFLPPRGVATQSASEKPRLDLRISYCDSLGALILDSYIDCGSIETMPERVSRTYDGSEAIDDRIRRLLSEIDSRGSHLSLSPNPPSVS